MLTHLRNPQGTANMHPLGPTSGGLQGSSSLGAEQALGLDSQGTCSAQPAARRHLEDPVACLGREQVVMGQGHWQTGYVWSATCQWYQLCLQATMHSRAYLRVYSSSGKKVGAALCWKTHVSLTKFLTSMGYRENLNCFLN